MKSRIRSVYMTFPDEESASRVARTLVNERLAACVNVLPGARSFYEWEGRVEDDAEVLAFAKTCVASLPKLLSRVKELHPFEVPCAVVLDISDGLPEYLSWVEDATAHPGTSAHVSS